jgi:hypothetical protein
MIHASMNFTGWMNAMGPEVERIGEFLGRTTANPSLGHEDQFRIRNDGVAVGRS